MKRSFSTKVSLPLNTLIRVGLLNQLETSSFNMVWKYCPEKSLVSIEAAALAQSCASLKTAD